MACSIYKITNCQNNKIYIGSAICFRKRKALHLFHLRKGTHYNKHLQSSWDKYGENVFEFEVLEECNKEELLVREQYYIDLLKPQYNKRIIAESNLGRTYKMKEEHKKKIGLKHRKLSEEQVIEVVKLRKEGMIMREIGEMFGIDASCISRILNGKFYKGCVEEKDFNNKISYQWQAVAS